MSEDKLLKVLAERLRVLVEWEPPEDGSAGRLTVRIGVEVGDGGDAKMVWADRDHVTIG